MVIYTSTKPGGGRNLYHSYLCWSVCACVCVKGLFQQVVARDWCIGGWKQRTCSTVELSVSTAFMYLLRMAKISLLRIWYFLMRSAIFFSGCQGKQERGKKLSLWVKDVFIEWKQWKHVVHPPHFWWFHPCHPVFGLWEGDSRSQRGQSAVAVPTAQWWHSRPSSAHPQSTAWKNKAHITHDVSITVSQAKFEPTNKKSFLLLFYPLLLMQIHPLCGLR